MRGLHGFNYLWEPISAMQQKKVLIISYYWPPSGGAGVQRWLKFTKYLPEFGWMPVVYTPENPEFPSTDVSLLEEVSANCQVIKKPITEPYNLYRKLLGLKPSEKIQTGFLSEERKPRRLERIARWVRGNFFIPDARFLWIKPSVRFLTKWLDEHPVDLIVSTGPPHSMHLIAREVKKRTGLPWVADFRDPWTDIDFYHELYLSKWADRRHHALEAAVLREADQVIAIGETMRDGLLAKEASAHIVVIPNGFDEADTTLPTVELDPRFVIAHIGSFSPARNPETLWKVLSELKHEHRLPENFAIQTIGKLDISVRDSIAASGLIDYLEHIPYLEHREVVQYQQRASLLLLVANRTHNAKGIVTGKVFEYLASKRPILAIGPVDGDLAALMQNTGAEAVIDYDDAASLKEALLNHFAAHPAAAETRMLDRYTREALTKQLTDLWMAL